MIRQIFMMGLVFGLCLSANLVARQMGGCGNTRVTLNPSSPCEVVMAAVNCTLCMVMVYFAYQLLSSSSDGGY